MKRKKKKIPKILKSGKEEINNPQNANQEVKPPLKDRPSVKVVQIIF